MKLLQGGKRNCNKFYNSTTFLCALRIIMKIINGKIFWMQLHNRTFIHDLNLYFHSFHFFHFILEISPIKMISLLLVCLLVHSNTILILTFMIIINFSVDYSVGERRENGRNFVGQKQQNKKI